MMMFRLPSPLPIDWGRFELGPPVAAALALGALLGLTAEAAGEPPPVLAAGALVAPPLQAAASRPTVATTVRTVRCFIAPPPRCSGVDRQAVQTLPDEPSRAPLGCQGLH